MSAVNVLRKRLAFATPLLESLFSLEAIISEWWVNEGGKMSTDTVEKLITNAIHTAFIKYPEGDGELLRLIRFLEHLSRARADTLPAALFCRPRNLARRCR